MRACVRVCAWVHYGAGLLTHTVSNYSYGIRQVKRGEWELSSSSLCSFSSLCNGVDPIVHLHLSRIS